MKIYKEVISETMNKEADARNRLYAKVWEVLDALESEIERLKAENGRLREALEVQE